MGIFRLKVVQRGTIIVDGVDSLEEAEEYIESCNPVDDVKWSGFLEAMQGGIELQKISILEYMTIREFADKIKVSPVEIIKWLFLRGKVKQLDSEIGFDDMKEFADQYGFICEKEGISNKRMIDIERGCRKIIKLDVRAAPSFYIMKKSGYYPFVLETFWILGIL